MPGAGGDLSALFGGDLSALANIDLSSLLGGAAGSPAPASGDLNSLLRQAGLSSPPVGDDDPDPPDMPAISEDGQKVVARVVAAKEKRDAVRTKQRPEQGAMYIVLKAANHEELMLSCKTGLWAVSAETEEALNHAYDKSSCVVLIFSVRDTGFFIGYAFMSTVIRPREEQPASLDFDALPDHWGNPFRVSWVRIGSVPFRDVSHLKNKHDGGRAVIHARDGQVLPEAEAHQLCNEIDYAAYRCAIKVGVSRVQPPPRPPKAKHGDVTEMGYEEYVVSVLTKRKQRLRSARRQGGPGQDESAKRRKKEGGGNTRKVAPPSSADGETEMLEGLLKNPEVTSLLNQLTAPGGALSGAGGADVDEMLSGLLGSGAAPAAAPAARPPAPAPPASAGTPDLAALLGNLSPSLLQGLQ